MWLSSLMSLTYADPPFGGESTTTPNLPAGAMMSIVVVLILDSVACEEEVVEAAASSGGVASSVVLVSIASGGGIGDDESSDTVLLARSSPTSPTSPTSLPTSLKTVIFLFLYELLLPNNLLTLIAVISLTLSPSTAIILSPKRTFPTNGLSSRMLNTYAGPGEAGGSGVTRTMPSFPEGAMISNGSVSGRVVFFVMGRMLEEASVSVVDPSSSSW
mmetsp:Transcript_44405/g.79649  ORF Transcript_44405/g.79649 Transcript_44405/m.79649 type:complete len:216 (+) Transcript_44405:264-911(+)